MLPAHQRLTRAAEFTSTVRGGRRAGRPRVVVHVQAPPQRPEPESSAPGAVVRPDREPGPVHPGGSARVGLVVSKGVGPAVVRNRVARRLRHVVAPLLVRVPAGSTVVLRALPAAATATSAELAGDVASALRRLDALGPAAPDPSP